MGEDAFKIPGSFSLTPLKISQIPPENKLLNDAQTLLEASLSWKAEKIYSSGETFSHSDYNAETKKTYTWHCAVTEFHKDEVSFNRLWAKLGRNKAWNQKSYVVGIDKVTRVRYISEWQSIWTTLFIHPPPMSPRVYTVYQVSWLQEFSHRRRGIVVTLPIDLSSKTTRDLAELEEGGIKARYVSVEHIQEMDGDSIEWRQIVGVDARGLIPKYWVNRKMGKNMVEEFAACIEWLKNTKLEEAKEDHGEGDAPRSSTSKKDAQIQTEEAIEVINYKDGDTGPQTT